MREVRGAAGGQPALGRPADSCARLAGAVGALLFLVAVERDGRFAELGDSERQVLRGEHFDARASDHRIGVGGEHPGVLAEDVHHGDAVADQRRVAYCPDIAGIGVEPGVERACRNAALGLVAAGVSVEEVAFDLGFARDAFLALRGEWFVAWMYDKLEHLDRFGVNVRNNTNAGLDGSPRALGAAHHARGRVWHLFRKFFARYDHLLTPTMCVAPFPVE